MNPNLINIFFFFFFFFLLWGGGGGGGEGRLELVIFFYKESNLFKFFCLLILGREGGTRVNKFFLQRIHI